MKNKFIKLILLCTCLVLLETLTYFLAKITPITPMILTDYFHENLLIIKGFVIFYYLWYIMLFILPIFLYFKNREALKNYIMTYIMVIILAFPIFFFFPTIISRPEIVGNDIFSFLLKVAYFFDTPAVNCFPSMHCTLCFMFIYYSLTTKEIKWYYKLLIVILSFLIIISTILVKQHVIYDILGAFILTIIAVFIIRNTNLSKYGEKILKKFSL